jgi:hypothetical protein
VLLAHAERRLSTLGCVKINLQVLDGNEDARRFYEANGYAVENRISMGKELRENMALSGEAPRDLGAVARMRGKGVARVFTEEQKERLKQWSNVYGWSAEQCTAAAEKDEVLRGLLDVEMDPTGMPDEASAIRGQITSIEVCHRRCTENVDRILGMIGEMKPSSVLGCGDTDARLAAELRETMSELAAWVDGRTEQAGRLESVLGERTPAKRWLAACLWKTLAGQLAGVPGAEPPSGPRWPVV